VIDSFVEKLVMSELGFERAETAVTGRPGCDPRDLSDAKVEIGLATMAYNLKRITNVLSTVKLMEALHRA
jgi:transposase